MSFDTIPTGGSKMRSDLQTGQMKTAVQAFYTCSLMNAKTEPAKSAGHFNTAAIKVPASSFAKTVVFGGV